MLVGKKQDISIDQCKNTAFALILIFALFSFYRGDLYLMYPTIIVVLISMTKPGILRPLASLWYKLSDILGIIVSTILLTLIFYLMVTPVGVVIRLFKKLWMKNNKWGNSPDSAFIDREHTYTKSDLKNPY